MTKLVLPAIPRTKIYESVEGPMSLEWLDFFRDLYSRVGGFNTGGSDETETALATGLFDITRDFGSEIDELRAVMATGAFTPSKDETMDDIFTSIGKNKTQKDLTFANDTGTVSLFTVTGDVWVSIIPVITTSVTSAASADISLGVTGNTNAMIVNSLSTGLDARGIWVDQTPDNEIEPLDRVRSYIITDGNDIFLTLSAQVDAGAITFYCFWTPLSVSGLVEAA